MTKNLVYQIELEPITSNSRDKFSNFVIYLDKEFAKRTLEKKIEPSLRNRLQELGREWAQSFGLKYSSPYHFEKDSLLITQISGGGDGSWINTNRSSIDSLLKYSRENTIKYHPHNVDHSIDAIALLTLFSKWVDYSQVILKE